MPVDAPDFDADLDSGEVCIEVAGTILANLRRERTRSSGTEVSL